MTKKLQAAFDGQVLRPLEPLDLTPNETYHISIEISDQSTIPVTSNSSAMTAGEDLWLFLDRMEGTVEAPTDWSDEHDHYLYGTPKKSSPSIDEP